MFDSPVDCLIDFAAPSEPVSPSTLGADIYARFDREPDCLAIAVVGEDARPVGIVERNAFFLKMGAEFGRALFARRPATFVMEAPRLERHDAPVMDFFKDSLSRDPASLLKGFIVVDDEGRYLAVGTALSLLESGYRAAEARIRRLAALSTELAAAEREATAASRAKSNFLAAMSHEIRTPLNGVLAVAEVIDHKLEQEELRPYVGAILQSGRTLHRLLSDTLDLSRGEAGAVALMAEPLELAPLVQELDALWRPSAESKGLTFSVMLEPAPNAAVEVDGVRLRQVLNNLIGNAMKFTGSGGIDVVIKARAQDGACALEAVVRDTGPGIAPDQMARIFEPFAKLDERQEGAGLGLAICRQLTAAMGGEIRADSVPGEGAVFRISMRLPWAGTVPAALERPPAEAPSSPEARVLIVDDNPANRLVAGAFMDMAGFAWTTACDGQEAVEAAALEAFDLILMDAKMPVMGGVEAARRIRQGHGPNRDTPILAVTANTDPRDAAEYLSVGMNGYVPKPISGAELFAAIARIEATSPQAQAA